MNVDVAQELLNELGSSLENLETQQAALMQLLKDNGTVTDDQLAPYLTQAGKASSVRWRAAHIRLERLFSAEKQKEEKLAEEGHRLASAVRAPPQDKSQDQGEEAKSKKDEGGGTAAPQREAAATNATKETAGSQPASEKKSEQGEPATGEDKQTSPKQEESGA
jgi:hypothetical protein